MDKTCTLTSGGAVETIAAVDSWIEIAATRVLESAKAPFVAKVWAYREGTASLIACDLEGADRRCKGFTFIVGSAHDFCENDPQVPDAAEAIHMIGLLVKRLNATVVFV